MKEDPKAVGPHGGQALNKVHRSYFRAARWSRMATWAFWVMVLVFLLWALPWVPLGMSTGDYSLEVVLGLLLLGCCPAVTAVALLTRGMAAQRREALIAWASIYDRATGLRNRDYFLERLALQCQLGRELAEFRVGLILIDMEEVQQDGKGSRSPDDAVFRLIGMSVASQMRPNDLVAAIGSTEVGVLVSVANPGVSQAVAERIRDTLNRKLDEMAGLPGWNLTIRMGSASLNDAQSDPEALLAAARRSFKVIRRAPTQTHAA